MAVCLSVQALPASRVSTHRECRASTGSLVMAQGGSDGSASGSAYRAPSAACAPALYYITYIILQRHILYCIYNMPRTHRLRVSNPIRRVCACTSWPHTDAPASSLVSGPRPGRPRPGTAGHGPAGHGLPPQAAAPGQPPPIQGAAPLPGSCEKYTGRPGIHRPAMWRNACACLQAPPPPPARAPPPRAPQGR